VLWTLWWLWESSQSQSKSPDVLLKTILVNSSCPMPEIIFVHIQPCDKEFNGSCKPKDSLFNKHRSQVDSPRHEGNSLVITGIVFVVSCSVECMFSISSRPSRVASCYSKASGHSPKAVHNLIEVQEQQDKKRPAITDEKDPRLEGSNSTKPLEDSRIGEPRPLSSCHHQAQNACIASMTVASYICRRCTPVAARPFSSSWPITRSR
jgi:hypothetical protein